MTEPPNVQDLDGEFAAFLENFSPGPDGLDPTGCMPSLGMPLDAEFGLLDGQGLFPLPTEGLAQSTQQGSRESATHNGGSASRSDNSQGTNGAAGAGTSGRGPGGAAPPLDRKTRTLEKNRRAQKRFRDKQKTKMADTEAAVQRLEEQLAKATEERACLERQHEVLKKVMELRQAQVDRLSQRAGVGEEAFEAVALRRLSPSEEPLHELEPDLTEGALREMSNDVAIARWRGYVRSMEALSAQTRRVSATDCCEEGKQVRRQAGAFVHRLALKNPLTIKVLMATNFESGAIDESQADCEFADEGFWARAVEAVELSAEQRQQVLRATSTLLSELTRVRAEREKIGAKLEQTLPALAAERRSLSETIRIMRSIAELRRSFTQEHNAWTDYMARVLGKVLTGPQWAAYCIHSYPYFPNAGQLSKHVVNTTAAAEGDGGAEDESDRELVSVIRSFSEQLQLWTLSGGAPVA